MKKKNTNPLGNPLLEPLEEGNSVDQFVANQTSSVSSPTNQPHSFMAAMEGRGPMHEHDQAPCMVK